MRIATPTGRKRSLRDSPIRHRVRAGSVLGATLGFDGQSVLGRADRNTLDTRLVTNSSYRHMKRHPTYAMDYPYRFASDGMTARTSRADHMRDLIEQLLFTRQGERLGRPTLGCGLPDLLFGPLNEDIATAARMTIQVALQEFLARQIESQALNVRVDGSALLIDLVYCILDTGEEARMSLRAEAEQG